MRVRTMSICLALVAACAKAEQEPAADTTAMGMEPAPAPTISLASLAGTWDVVSTPTSGGDTSSTRYTLTATADSTGWTFKFPNRAPTIPMRIVAVGGDSVVTEAGPFESSRRKGVQVSSHSVMRLEGDRLVGTTHARYQTTGADSTLTLNIVGTRAP